MGDLSDLTQPVFETLTQLRRDWLKTGWSWDTRVNCVASSFSVELAAEARRVILKSLPYEFDHRSVQKAPSLIQDIAQIGGGVRPDQRLFCSTLKGDFAGFGLWWPWGDDTTISLRVGLAGFVSDEDLLQLRQAFNALD